MVLTSIILFILFAHRVFQKNIFGNLLNIFKLFSFNQINTGLLKISPSLKTYTIFYLLGFLMINIYLAGNPYNSYMYSVTLVTPFLILMIIQNLSAYKGLSLLVASLVIINIVQFYFYSNKVLVQKIPNFIKIERILKTKRNILSDPYFSTIIADQKKSVWDTGQTQIFKMLTIDSVPLYMRLPAQRVWQAYVTHVENQIANKQYDLVVLYTGYLESDLYRLKGKNLLMKNYYISQYIGNEELWLPKP